MEQLERQRQLAKKMGLSDKLVNTVAPEAKQETGAKHPFNFDHVRKKRKTVKASRRRNRKK